MKKISDGRRPAWLRSFHYRLVFFSSLTITAIITVFGIAVLILFSFMEIDRVDKVLLRSSEEIADFFKTTERPPAYFWQDRTITTVFQIYNEEMSLLFHLPPGVSAPTISPSLLQHYEDLKDPVTFTPEQDRLLLKLWWIMPWRCIEDRDLWRISVTPTTISGNRAFLVAMVSLAPLLESRHLLFWMIILIGTAGILLSLIVGKMVAGQAIKPLKAIKRALARVSRENMDRKSE